MEPQLKHLATVLIHLGWFTLGSALAFAVLVVSEWVSWTRSHGSTQDMTTGDKTAGQRVYNTDIFKAAEYGQYRGHWYACTPVGDLGSLDNHHVTEHEDGTITVTPSILVTYAGADAQRRWHGFLTRGVWEEV